jgi:hypothetical protein
MSTTAAIRHCEGCGDAPHLDVAELAEVRCRSLVLFLRPLDRHEQRDVAPSLCPTRSAGWPTTRSRKAIVSLLISW